MSICAPSVANNYRRPPSHNPFLLVEDAWLREMADYDAELDFTSERFPMRWIVCLAVLTFVPAALAQTTQPADASSPTTQPDIVPADQLLTQMLRPQADQAKPIQPVAGPPAVNAATGSGSLAPNAPAMPLLREGTDILERSGYLRKTNGDLPEFVFDSDGRTLEDPPMLVLPNLKLMQMENALSSATTPLHFRVSGTVTEYRGRNYILLDKVVVIEPNMVDN